MNAISASLADSATMLRRNFRHTTRNPVALFNGIVMPVFLMFLMVYVFGGAFSVGVDYADYATPGLILTTICYGIGSTAIAVNSDMTNGFINRLRVMDVSRAAVLNAHVIESVLRSLVAITLVTGVALLMGFRPSAGLAQWLGVVGIVVLTVVAISWLTVAAGLAAKTPESAGMTVVPLMLLPFLSSAFVPADKMGPGARQFAEHQPFTSIIEALRGLLTGAPSASSIVTAIAWCVGVTLIGYLWARRAFTRQG
ncbi:transport permease protein [Planobispora rosea]|uniref:Transport permease protein n=1 Tax=Planobispora rosea TaxID=35762 RepID=A0A8J3RVB2_PLARO|nr:ABC transporter permease [Planobispora rosea]GGS68672.1 transport permease protein [Planobispora rosea]GIH82035.1 transport permease protein [Planobispora rosea]